MIVLVHDDATPEDVRGIEERVSEMGLTLTPLTDAKGRAFEVTGSERGRVLELRGVPGIAEVLTRRRALTGGEPLWPHFALRVCILILLIGTVLVLLAAFAPPALGDRADPADWTGQHGVLEWHLRPLAGLMDLLPGRIGGVAVLLFWLVFLLWPFLDRADETTPVGRRVARLVRIGGVALIIFVLVLGLGAVG